MISHIVFPLIPIVFPRIWIEKCISNIPTIFPGSKSSPGGSLPWCVSRRVAGWVAGGCWDYHEQLWWIIPSFPTFRTSKTNSCFNHHLCCLKSLRCPCWAVLFSTVSTWQAPHQRVSGRQVVSTTFGAAWDEVDVPCYIIFIHSLEISEISPWGLQTWRAGDPRPGRLASADASGAMAAMARDDCSPAE